MKGRVWIWGIPWLIVIIMAIYSVMSTVDDWMVLRKLYVHDSEIGTSPKISVDLKFYRTFVLRWHAVVRQARSSADGDFVGACVTDGEATVSPTRRFPPTIDLDWWMNPAKCDLGVGSYYLETIFSWSTVFGDRSIVEQSNMFHVAEKTTTP